MSKLAKMMLLSKSGKDRDRIDWESDKTRRYDRDRRDMRYDDSDRDRYRDDRMDDRRDSRREMRYDDGRRYPENRMYEHREMRHDDGMRRNAGYSGMNMGYSGGYDYVEDRMNRGTGRIAPRMEYMPDVSNAFYDRRGRRHYDNGRYAPMDTYDDGYGEPYHGTTIGFTMPQNHHERGYEFEAEGNGGFVRGNVIPIGTEHSARNGMSGRRISKGGMIERDEPEELDSETAKRWVASMKNVDGTKGQHFSMEQTEQLLKQYGIDCPLPTAYAALNMMWSDYRDVARKFNADKPEFYLCLMKSFLSDPDIPGGGEEKLAKYYDYIVR